jgi:hypothetical protein
VVESSTVKKTLLTVASQLSMTEVASMDDFVSAIELRRTMERGKVKANEAAVVKTVKMLMLVPRKEMFDSTMVSL